MEAVPDRLPRPPRLARRPGKENPQTGPSLRAAGCTERGREHPQTCPPPNVHPCPAAGSGRWGGKSVRFPPLQRLGHCTGMPAGVLSSPQSEGWTRPRRPSVELIVDAVADYPAHSCRPFIQRPGPAGRDPRACPVSWRKETTSVYGSGGGGIRRHALRLRRQACPALVGDQRGDHP